MNFLKQLYHKVFPKQVVQTAQQKEDTDSDQEVVSEIFTVLIEFVKTSTLTDSQRLTLYGLYKQATVGNCNTNKPAMYELVNSAKWESWSQLKGVKKAEAMRRYINMASHYDPAIQSKMRAKLSGVDSLQQGTHSQQPRIGLKAVEQVDYSDQYSHPYFKAIIKKEAIEVIERELLLKMNNSPAVYPLQFAIDNENIEMVGRFLQLLSGEEVSSMRDQSGMSVLEYANYTQNEEIIGLITAKLRDVQLEQIKE